MSKLIVFEGYLEERYPEGIRIEAGSAAEAISALENFPGFEIDGPKHYVSLPDFQSYDSLYLSTELEVIKVVPVLEGGGGKPGIMQVIIGAVIVGAAILTGNPFIANGALTLTGQVATAGLMMALGGVMQMLMPQPHVGGTDPSSHYIPANKNKVAVGTPIPMLFGTRRIWGHILGYNVTATNLGAPSPATTLAATAPISTSPSPYKYTIASGEGAIITVGEQVEGTSDYQPIYYGSDGP